MSCYFRHAMLVNQSTETVTVPLNAQLDCVGKLELANSLFIIHSHTKKTLEADVTVFDQAH